MACARRGGACQEGTRPLAAAAAGTGTPSWYRRHEPWARRFASSASGYVRTRKRAANTREQAAQLVKRGELELPIRGARCRTKPAILVTAETENSCEFQNSAAGFDRVRCQNCAAGLDLGIYAARSYSLRRPPRTGRRSIRFWEGSATGGRAGAGGVRGCGGVVVRCSAGQTRRGPSAGAVHRRSASGRSSRSGR
jgi:hypothetical protein